MKNTNKKTSVRLVIPNLSNLLKDIDSKHREWTKHFEGYECGIRENGDCYVVVDVEDIACKIMFGMRWDSVDMRIDDIRSSETYVEYKVKEYYSGLYFS